MMDPQENAMDNDSMSSSVTATDVTATCSQIHHANNSAVAVEDVEDGFANNERTIEQISNASNSAVDVEVDFANNERTIEKISHGTTNDDGDGVNGVLPTPIIAQPPKPERNTVLHAMDDPVNETLERRERLTIKMKKLEKPNEISTPKPFLHPDAHYAKEKEDDDLDDAKNSEMGRLELLEDPPTQPINPIDSVEDDEEAAGFFAAGNQRRNDTNSTTTAEETTQINNIPASNVSGQEEDNSSHREEASIAPLEEDDRTSSRQSDTLQQSHTTFFYDGSDARVQFAPLPSVTSDPEEDLEAISCDSDHPYEVPNAYVVQSRAKPPSIMMPSFMARSAIIAEPLEPETPWYKKLWGKVLIMVIVVLALVVIFLIVLEARRSANDLKNIPAEIPTVSPSFSPSMSPSHDDRPTLEIVRERGELWCGLQYRDAPLDEQFSSQEQQSFFDNNTRGEDWVPFYFPTNSEMNFCRAIASVVLGDPNAIQAKHMTFGNRFFKLNNREIDVLMMGDFYKLEREIREPMTQVGFAFSKPYFSTGIAYGGETSLVECAEKRSRFGDPCSRLKICVLHRTSVSTFLREFFPPSFLYNANLTAQLIDGLTKGECNVIAAEMFTWSKIIRSFSSLMGTTTGSYALGNSIMEQQYMSIVTRNNDLQWIDIVAGTVDVQTDTSYVEMAVQNTSYCPLNSTNTLGINFMSAPACIGNVYANVSLPEELSSFIESAPFGEIMERRNESGMVWAPVFGDLSCSSCPDALKEGTLARIKQRGHLNCGVIVDDNLPGLTEMGEIYCRAIAVAIFLGDITAVEIVSFASFSETVDFYTVQLDVVAGGSRYSLVNDWSPIEWNSELSGDYAFSIPYYYQDIVYPNIYNYTFMKEITLVTQAGDPLWSSFVNSAVVCGINAVGLGINKESGSQMPLIGLFGPELRWIFRDVVLYSGHYDEIFAIAHNLTDDDTFDRGPNKASQAIFYWEY
mmetsp:Transcript_18811/g.39619  ORF Transcript_18811/g.39619 Transcript_18811/m.39619 type:complete len:968 (-) Transcript_18811:291-3194(-)